MDKYIGKRLDGRYEIMEMIGMGGMANVYKAYDVIDDRIVAVKILRDEYLNNEEFLRRFKNESKAIAVLSHPNIVKVYDVSFSPHMQSIVMEYIDGITLKEYIEQQGVVKWKEAVYFIVQILRALQHAHDRGIVHRDIKPQNIMLLPDGTIKVTDFGIARFARSESHTITDKAIGSVHYISPEQATGETVDEKSDLYSVGVVLFELLTGKLPFEASSPVSVAIKQIQSQAVRPRVINASIPEGLEEIVIRAMQKDPQKRYRSAAEMLRDIEEFKKNPSISFEYHYLDNGEHPQVRQREAVPVPAGQARRPGDKKGREDTMKKDREEETEVVIEKKTPVIPILAGITVAVVIVTAIFVFSMIYINKPFESVEEVSLPDLRGMVYDDIKNDARYNIFDLVVELTDYNENYPKGQIYEQNPNPGRTVKVGSKVKIRISDGAKRIILEDYSGQDAAVVYEKLKGLNLNYTTIEEYNPNIPEGTVIKTEPGPETVLSPSSEIRVFVSKGSQFTEVTVPNLVGQNIDDAVRFVEGIKLKIGNRTKVESDLPEGTIVAQDPAEKTKMAEGGYINVQVSAGENSPNYVTLQVALPTSMKDMATLQAEVDGKLTLQETLEPAKVLVWQPTFEGEGLKEVKILIDGKEYQTFEIDLDEGTSELIDDFSADFK